MKLLARQVNANLDIYSKRVSGYSIYFLYES